MGTAAKNTLVVGAVNSGGPSAAASLGRMTTFSSWGPTRDGRIKPDIVTAGAENNTRDLNPPSICGAPGAPAVPLCDPDPTIGSTMCTDFACTSISNLAANQYAGLRGTSMAAPAATGAIGLVMQQQGISGLAAMDVPLDSDSTKAVLIHTATDLQSHVPVGGPFMTLGPCGSGGVSDCWPIPTVAPGTIQDGPDYVNGWGLLNIPAALNKVISRNPQLILQPSGCSSNLTLTQFPFNSPLAVGGNPAGLGLVGCPAAIWDFVGYINVPAGTTQLKVTIAWDDRETAVIPNTNSTGSILVNDLDLIVTRGTGMGGSFVPQGPHNYTWWLDPACPYRQAAPVSSNSFNGATFADHRNNVEQVVINNPAAGQYRIVVQSVGGVVLAQPQPFSMVISMPPSAP
jgi:hypothetical protein